MTTITRPTGDQLLFQSANTGEHVLDSYLEAAEIGGRALSALLGDLFSPVSGAVRPDIVQFRLNPTTRELESRATGGDWAGSGAFFSRYRGDFAAGQSYKASDYVRISGTLYLVTVDHTASGAPNMANFTDLLNSPALSAIGAASGAAADRVPYFTGSASAAFAPFTAQARALVANTTAAGMRSTLGLGALATSSTAAVPSFTMAAGGDITLAQAPTLALHAATKAYVDAVASGSQPSLGYTPANRAGDSFTGFVTLHANPTNALHAVTKQYADGLLGSRVALAGGDMTGTLTNSVADLAFVATSSGSSADWRGRIMSRNASGNVAAFLGTHNGRAIVAGHTYALTGWTDLYINTADGAFGGAVRFPNMPVTIGGSQVWHAGNLYEPDFMKFRGDVGSNLDGVRENGARRVEQGGFSGSLLTWAVGGSTDTIQLYGAYQGTLMWRVKVDNTTWQPWWNIYHQGNFTEGNHYVSNSRLENRISDVVAAYTAYGYSRSAIDSAFAAYLPRAGSTSMGAEFFMWGAMSSFAKNGQSLGGPSYALEVRSDDGGGAFLGLVRAGQYGIMMGLDSDNAFRLGRWSDGGTVRMTLTTSAAGFPGTVTAGGLLYGRGGGAGLGQVTVSTSAPSGGAAGDLWLRY